MLTFLMSIVKNDYDNCMTLKKVKLKLVDTYFIDKYK
jgi:hypothetical protein